MRVSVGISNRHVHLTKEVYDTLFSSEMEVLKAIHQPGEFASKEVVDIKTDKGILSQVRVMGPCRNYNQVEISMSDAYQLGILPPVRRSGNLQDSLEVTLVTEKASVCVKACILANRHVHMSEEFAKELHVEDGQIVYLETFGEKKAYLEAEVKTSLHGYFEVHLDRDDANANLLRNGDEVELHFEKPF